MILMANAMMGAAGYQAASAVQPLTLTFRTTTDMESVKIPCQDVGVFNATLDWGDGSSSEITTFNDVDLAHTYDIAGDYDVVVSGGFPNIFFNHAGDKAKLIAVSGGQQHSFDAVDGAFFGVANLAEVSAISTSSVTNLYTAWYGCSSLTSFPLINTSSGTNFGHAWHSCSSLTSFPLINTSSGTNFSYAWYGCSSLTSFPLINTSSGTNFGHAWRNCTSLTDFPSGFFDTWTGAPAVNCFLSAWVSCTALTPASVINILMSIDTSGQSAPASGFGITIAYAGGDISAASTAIANLKSRGWTVTINGVAQ